MSQYRDANGRYVSAPERKRDARTGRYVPKNTRDRDAFGRYI